MKNISIKMLVCICVLTASAAVLGGCENNTEDTSTGSAVSQSASVSDSELPTELQVSFGNGTESFTLYLEDNDTARAIARHVGTADWSLPIYHYNDYENWEVMQYYDIPSRYEIPSAPETITAEAGGEVYYSEPNRIIMFYHDAEVTGDYTKVGHFEYSDDFVEAVENNPVVEGWGNKIINISAE